MKRKVSRRWTKKKHNKYTVKTKIFYSVAKTVFEFKMFDALSIIIRQ